MDYQELAKTKSTMTLLALFIGIKSKNIHSRMSPEMINRTGYDKGIDIWAAGITICELLRKRLYASDISTLNMLFETGRYRRPYRAFPEQVWEDISPATLEFLDIMLCADPNKRPPAEELFKLKFLRTGLNNDELGGLFRYVFMRSNFRDVGMGVF